MVTGASLAGAGATVGTLEGDAEVVGATVEGAVVVTAGDGAGAGAGVESAFATTTPVKTALMTKSVPAAPKTVDLMSIHPSLNLVRQQVHSIPHQIY